ncbi:MAG: RDD family protein [Acidobacteria bacterium]|nr:RDD family protein [Acidobacteriota bacterium]
MTGVPLEDSGAALDSKRCSGCGHWVAIQAQRCDRCGRLLRNRDAAARLRRGFEQAEALPEPSAPPPPRPSPEPEWKRELQERLAGYRDRLDPLADAPRPALDLPPPKPAAAPQIRPRPKLPEARPASYVRPAPADSAPVARLPETTPPIIDLRPTGGDSPRLARLEPIPAPLSIRAIAGAMDLGVALLATGLFMGIVSQVEQVSLSPDEAVRVIGAALALNLTCYLLCFLLYAGRTAGMSWLGLSVLNLDGEPPAAAQRRSRAFGTLLSLAALGVGFIWAAADEQGLTWHDRMSRTFVAQDDPLP